MTEKTSDKLKVPDFPFTEDQFHRTTNNLRITVNRLTRRSNSSLTPEDKSRLYSDFCAVDTMATLLYMRFFVQFNHKPSARRICPNPDCHHIYAFFFDDWEYCPQCGTKLLKTVYEEEE